MVINANENPSHVLDEGSNAKLIFSGTMGLELSSRVISGFHPEGSHAVEFLNLFLETLIIF